ncbi:MAG: histidine phosphatase family protein [Polyangiaceae bacterium]
MELVLVRHGEPKWVSDDGRPEMDPALTPRGRAQAKLAAEALAGSKKKPAELIVSPARRARETAEPFAHALGLTPLVIDDLTEFRLPDWTSLDPIEVADRFRKMRERPLDSWWSGADGGETFHDFEARVRACLFDLLRARGVEPLDPASRHPRFRQVRDPGRIVIVAHGGTNALVTSLLLGMQTVPWVWEAITLNHASFVRLRVIPLGGASVVSLRSQNECEHLPKELRTR